MEFDPIFEGSPLPMLLLDPNGTVLEVNPAFAAWIGLGRDELAARNWWNLVSPADLGRALTQFGRIVQGEEEHVRFDLRLAARRGDWKHGAVWCRKLSGGAVFCQIADTSARAQAAAENAALRTQVGELSRESETLRNLLRNASEHLARCTGDAVASELEETCRMASRPLERRACDLTALVRRAAAKVVKRLPAMGPVWRVAELPTVALDHESATPAIEEMLEVMVQSAADHTVEAGSYMADGVPVLFFRYQPRLSADKGNGMTSDLAAPSRLAQRHGGSCWVEQDHGHTIVCLTFEPLHQAA